MHGFRSVFQFQTEKRVQTAILYIDTFINGEWSGPGFFYPRINDIVSKNSKTYYLAVRNGMYSSKNVSAGIQAFTIEDETINDSIRIFRTQKNFLNSIDCFYNWDGEQNPIRLSSDKQKLYIPIVDGEIRTNKFLVYKFDGNNYVFDKNLK